MLIRALTGPELCCLVSNFEDHKVVVFRSALIDNCKESVHQDQMVPGAHKPLTVVSVDDREAILTWCEAWTVR